MINLTKLMIGEYAESMPDGEPVNLIFKGEISVTITITVKDGFFTTIEQNPLGIDFIKGDDWAMRISWEIDESPKSAPENIVRDVLPNPYPMPLDEGTLAYKNWEALNPEEDEDEEFDVVAWECPFCKHQNDDDLQSCEMCGFDFEGELVGDDTDGDDVNLGMADLLDA